MAGQVEAKAAFDPLRTLVLNKQQDAPALVTLLSVAVRRSGILQSVCTINGWCQDSGFHEPPQIVEIARARTRDAT